MKYYHIFGVKSITGEDMNPTLCMDFLVQFDDNDLENKEVAKAMSENLLLKTTTQEAIEACDLSTLASSIHATKLITRFNNNISVHKFITDFPLNREDLDMFVSAANRDVHCRKKLAEARINY